MRHKYARGHKRFDSRRSCNCSISVEYMSDKRLLENVIYICSMHGKRDISTYIYSMILYSYSCIYMNTLYECVRVWGE